MEAVKMPGTTQVKSQSLTRTADVSKGGDEFMKLLQTKKEQIQPDKADEKTTEGKDSKKDDKDVTSAQDKKEDSDGNEEKVSSKDGTDQDALLQAAMQQTAAQMAGIITEQPAEQSVEPKNVQIEALAGAASAMEEVQPEIPVAAEEQPVMEAVQEPKEKGADTTADNETGQKEQDISKSFGETRTPDREPEVQDFTSQPQVKPQEKVQTEEKTEANEGLYSTAAVRNDTNHSFAAQKTEEIPLKTSQDTLPQDLGRTLADRFPGTGRELVVELEPANLGKLTIKMVYEAGRAAVSIMATNPKTLEILNQKAAEIASILEEKTGQETIIYTEAPQQENQEENPDGNQGGRGEHKGQEEKHSAKDDKHRDVESFAQQLRLGLV